MPYWRLAGVYFSYFAVVGAMSPYWGLYLKSLGFAPDVIGVIAALPLLTKLLAPNLWGWLADRSGRQLLVIRLGAFGATLFFVGLLWSRSYFAIALFVLAYSFFWNAILPQFEVATLGYLGTAPQRYSGIRLWGSVGFIVAVLLLGYVFDQVALRWLPRIVCAVLLVIFLCSCTLPPLAPRRASHGDKSFLDNLRRPAVALFFLVLFFLQFSHGVYYVFYSIYMESFGYSKTLIGVFWTVGVLAEIVMFINMPQLMRRFSLYRLLSFSLLLTALRWCLIAFAANSLPVVVLAQSFHAFSFAVTHAVAIEFLRRNFGERSQGQGQAFYSAVSFGGGAALGAYVSGILWQLSPQLAFVVAAGAAGLAYVLTARILKPSLDW